MDKINLSNGVSVDNLFIPDTVAFKAKNLTVIMDLADRKIIGSSMDSMSAGLTVADPWKMAVNNRPLERELIFHSDRGIQYASHEFRRCFKGFPVLQSMSRKGNCWDDAIAESFFKTLKTEMVYHRKFETRAQAKLEIFDYIEVSYNRKRRHSAHNYLNSGSGGTGDEEK